MIRILITNGWSWYNKGDAAIIITMGEALRRYLPDSNISILSFSNEVDSSKYKKYHINVKRGLRFIRNRRRSKVLKLLVVLNRMLGHFIWAISYRFFKKNFKRLMGEGAETLDEYVNADVIISCGGEVLFGKPNYFLLNLYEIFLGKLLLKPVIIYSQSIGPFRKKMHKSIIKFFLNRADIITVRERISLKYLREIGVNKPPIFLTADSAFLLRPVSREKAKRLLLEEGVYKEDRLLVGMTLRQWHFPELKDPTDKFDNYVRIMARVIDYLVDDFGAIVVFMPQVIINGEDDRSIAREVFQLTRNKKGFKILTKDYSPEELKGMIGYMDLFIGTRMHSNIFAASTCVPTIAIGYRHKTKGIMEMLGIEKYECEMSTLQFRDIIQKIQDAWTNKETLKESLKIKVEYLQERALYNGELVKNFVQVFSERGKN